MASHAAVVENQNSLLGLFLDISSGAISLLESKDRFGSRTQELEFLRIDRKWRIYNIEMNATRRMISWQARNWL